MIVSLPMARRRRLALVAVPALAMLALAGPAAHAQSPAAASAGAAMETYTVTAATTSLGTFLTGENGMTLYYFAADTTPGQSVCEGDCAVAWPPLTVDEGAGVVAGEGVSGVLGVISRSDGTRMVTYDGRPLYYFQGDAAAGDANGQGLKDVWWVALVDGSMPAPAAASPAS
jgi:predicted lipoprotein with Yx(FWY)xxD motif